MLKEWADMVLFANYETFIVTDDNKKAKAQGGKRVMYTSHHPCWDAKNRKGLPEKLPFDFKEIAHCLPSDEAAPTVKEESTAPKPLEKAQEQNTTVEGPPSLDDEKKKAMLALGQLMSANGVKDNDIQHVVGMKGYFPADMLIKDYPTEFINGVLVGAWEQVYTLIKTEKENAM